MLSHYHSRVEQLYPLNLLLANYAWMWSCYQCNFFIKNNVCCTNASTCCSVWASSSTWGEVGPLPRMTIKSNYAPHKDEQDLTGDELMDLPGSYRHTLGQKDRKNGRHASALTSLWVSGFPTGFRLVVAWTFNLLITVTVEHQLVISNSE